MATYVPNAADATQPTGDKPVESAALEFRTLKVALAAVTSVAGALADIATVAADLNEPVSEIETVATSIANVDAVGANIAAVNAVAANMAEVIEAAGFVSISAFGASLIDDADAAAARATLGLGSVDIGTAVIFSAAYGDSYIQNNAAIGTYYFSTFGSGGGPYATPSIPNAAFNESTGIFTCPVAGTYLFNLDFTYRISGGNNKEIAVGFSKNGGAMYSAWDHCDYAGTVTNWQSHHISFMVELAVNDTIRAAAKRISTGLIGDFVIEGTSSGFSGLRLR